MTDVSRLARFLTGTSIGLVLGGGGARSGVNSDNECDVSDS